MKPLVLTLLLTVSLAACSKAPEQQASAPMPAETASTANASNAAAPTETAAASSPPAAAAQCVACHKFGKDEPNTIGPHLFGVVGRKAGSVEGFAYSDALKASGITWDQAKLDAYLANPAKLIPGNKMPFAGIADASARKEVVDYLATLK